MATVRRSRLLRATPEELWAIVGDAYHLPRWWPRVTRVEGVDAEGFTQVLTTAKGASVRADFRVIASEPARLRHWEQQVVNTPFEKVVEHSAVQVRLEPEGAAAPSPRATRVVLVLDQRLRGMALLGSFLARRAGRRQLDDALRGLEALVGAP